MPDPDGWTVLRSLKEDSELCEIPVILATVLGTARWDLRSAQPSISPNRSILPILFASSTRVRLRNSNTDVLVVDDDPGTREMLRRALTREGWSVREAEDGDTGLEEVARSRPAVILLDLMMPRMDGFQMLAALRKNERTRDVPVVVVTSKDLTREERSWLEGNAYEVFQKGGYERSKLVETLRSMVEGARRAVVKH